MLEKLFDIIKKNWLNPKSIPFAFAFLFATYIILISKILEWNIFDLTGASLAIVVFFFFIVFLIYAVLCFIFRLPKAPKDTLAVLFIVDAENEQLYESAKFKLVNNFNASIEENNATQFKALCISKNTVPNFNLKKKDVVLRLLERTNCIFVVSVRYTADDVNNAEIFELKIDCDVRSSQLDKTARDILSHDMDILKAPVGTQKFVKSQTIDIFNATTQTLVGACQYVIGLVYLLSGDKKNAYALLSRIRNTVLVEYHDGLGMNVLKKLTDDRLFITLAQFAIEHMRNFKKDKNSHHLRNMCSVLEEANAIRPDTYFYNLNMAYAHVILNQNALLAKACIEKCKQLKQEKDWLYSDAFLSAYCGHAPGTILSKYKKAFSVPYEDLIEIVDYIEFVIEHQPQKNALHLAAGLVYEEIGDYTLMKQHLAIFMNESKELDRRIQSAIQQKMLASCNTSCDNNCFSCKRSPAA